jgi:hypothetical protein
MAFLISAILILQVKGENVGHLFTMLSSAFGEHKIMLTAKSISASSLTDVSEILTGNITEVIRADFNTPIFVLLLQIAGAYFAYIFGKRIQYFKVSESLFHDISLPFLSSPFLLSFNYSVIYFNNLFKCHSILFKMRANKLLAKLEENLETLIKNSC